MAAILPGNIPIPGKPELLRHWLSSLPHRQRAQGKLTYVGKKRSSEVSRLYVEKNAKRKKNAETCSMYYIYLIKGVFLFRCMQFIKMLD